MLNIKFIKNMLEKYSFINTDVYITDESANIVASNEEDKIGGTSITAQYVINILKSTAIKDDVNQDIFSYADVIVFNDTLYGAIVCHGKIENCIYNTNILKASIQTALEFQEFSLKGENNTNIQEKLARMLTSDIIDENKILSEMHKQEYNTDMLRNVIFIKINYHKMSYFNSNLNLGYLSMIEETHKQIISDLKKNKYLTSQDIIFSYDESSIAIIKSFLQLNDIAKIYFALDEICKNISQYLERFSNISYKMAYGNIQGSLFKLKESLNEAISTVQMGERIYPDKNIYILEDLIFDNVFLSLNPMIKNKIISPLINKLKKRDGTIMIDLLDTANYFVDNCMNLTKTSYEAKLHRNTITARMEKLKELTGLDPLNKFTDAFIIKQLVAFNNNLI